MSPSTRATLAPTTWQRPHESDDLTTLFMGPLNVPHARRRAYVVSGRTVMTGAGALFVWGLMGTAWLWIWRSL